MAQSNSRRVRARNSNGVINISSSYSGGPVLLVQSGGLLSSDSVLSVTANGTCLIVGNVSGATVNLHATANSGNITVSGNITGAGNSGYANTVSLWRQAPCS